MNRLHLDIAFDVKALDESGAFEGYASVFDIVDGFDDRVAPGAFAASLASSRGGRGVKMLWQHDASEPIGAWDSITEDARGLYVRGRLLPDGRPGAGGVLLLAPANQQRPPGLVDLSGRHTRLDGCQGRQVGRFHISPQPQYEIRRFPLPLSQHVGRALDVR